MLALSLLIISSVIGAGFATGAELIAFFGHTNMHPVMISVLFSAVMLLLIWMIVRSTPDNIKESDVHTNKYIFVPIYFIFFTALTAGVTSLSGWMASIVALSACIVVVLFGFERLLAFNKYIMAFVLVILLAATIPNQGLMPIQLYPPHVWRTVLMAILYAGMNCCILDAVITRAKAKWSNKDIMIASTFAIAVVALLATLILTAVRSNGTTADMPIIELAPGSITRIAVLLCVFTSQFVCLFNVSNLSGVVNKNQRTQGFILIGLCTVAFALSFFGFVRIIGALYPAVGAITIAYIIARAIKYKVDKAPKHV